MKKLNTFSFPFGGYQCPLRTVARAACVPSLPALARAHELAAAAGGSWALLESDAKCTRSRCDVWPQTRLWRLKMRASVQ